MITGSAGGIGKAIAKKFAEEGACVIINDIERRTNARDAMEEFQKQFGKDIAASAVLDVTNNETIDKAFEAAVLAFGGVDIIVNNAGISISKSIDDHTEEDWDKLYDILVKGQFLVQKQVLKSCESKIFGGDIINIVSKNAVVAVQIMPVMVLQKQHRLHLARLLAAELGAR